MSRPSPNTDHETVDALLPWFVNGTLDDSERAKVEAHVADCDACRDNIALLRDIQTAVNRDAATPLVPAPRPERLFAKIDAAEPRNRGGRRAWVAAAGVAALVVVAAAIWERIGTDDTLPAVYETATSASQPGSIDYIIELRFESGIDDATRDSVLQEIAGQTAPTAVTGGAYRIVMRLDAATLADLEGAVGAIEARPAIESARVVAVQLPVE